MSGLLDHYHDCGHLHECQEVGGLLLVAGRHPPVLLDLRPEPFAEVPILVEVRVHVALLGPALLRRDHRLGPARLDFLDQRLLVIALVGDHHLWLMVGQQRLGLGDVRLVGCRQEQLNRMAEPVETPVDLGAKPAAAAAKRLIVLAASPVPLFFDPAAHGWARTAVESRIKTSRSGSRRAARIGSQRPFLAQRSKRRQTVLCLPKRSGRSSQGMPVRATYRTASIKSRLSLATPPCWPRWPGRRCLIRSQSASEIAWRCNITGPPWQETRTAIYPEHLLPVHTA